MAAQAIAMGGLAGLQIWNGIQQAEMIRAQGQVQTQIAEMNAKWAEVDAWHAEQQGEEQVARAKTDEIQTIGAQRTALAAADVDVNFGTAAQIQEETKLTGFLNEIDMRNAARAKALGFKREARGTILQDQMQQSQNAMNARAAVTSGLLSAAQTGITGYTRK